MIDQALHGYADGHTLLATSLILSREQRTVLAQMTDLSGPAPVRGFDGYLSGFPLIGGIYVLARTWYATELPRPGCVWTHSLLLPQEVLNLAELPPLRLLFQRPQLRTGFDRYSAKIADPVHPLSKRGEAVSTKIGPVLSRLYAAPSARLCVPSESADELESAFFAIWSQQWPALRCAFSFTTGLLGGGAQRFDLQGVPSKNIRLFQGMVGVTLLNESNKPLEDWAEEAAADAELGTTDSGLRRFLWAFGRDFHNGREAFLGLCKVFGTLRKNGNDSSGPAIYECISQQFGESRESVPLKLAVFGGPPNPWAIDEVEALGYLASRELGEILDDTDARLHERSAALPLEKLETVVLRIATSTATVRARLIIDVFLERCRPSNLARVPVGILIEALEKRAELGRDESVWRRNEDQAIAVIQGLIAKQAFTEDTSYGLLRRGNLRLLYEARNASPAAWVRGAHSFADQFQPDKGTEEFILRRLSDSQSELREDLRCTKFGGFIKLAAVALDPLASEAEGFPLYNVDVHADLPRLWDDGADLQACAFLLLVGLVHKDTPAAVLMREGFSTIYQAAKEQRLPWALWRSLDTRLPWHFLEWDRCARLIEGAVDRFVENSWSPMEFFKTFSTEDEFDRALNLLTSKETQQYVRRLRLASQTESGGVASFQHQKLSSMGPESR